MYENITRFPTPQRKSPFSIQMCGVSYCDDTYFIHRPQSGIYCMEYILVGKGTVQVDDTVFTAEAGDIYILPARHRHMYYADAKNPWIKIWFNISGELVDQLFTCYKLENAYHITNLPIYPLFREFLDAAAATEDFYAAQDACAQVFLKIVQALAKHIHLNQPQNTTLAHHLKEKIDNLTDFALDFDTLLSDLYCTKSHAIRAFKKEFGITPYNYLLQKKLLHAKMLLENSAMPIRDIAFALGFHDSHYFSNFFKKQTGIRPQAYKNKFTKQFL